MCVAATSFRYKLEFIAHVDICVRTHLMHKERYDILKQDYLLTEVRPKAWVSKQADLGAIRASQPFVATFQQETIKNFFPTLPSKVATGQVAKLSVEGANYALATMIVDAQLPFALCENESFLEYIHHVFMLGKSGSVLTYKVPSRRTVEDHITLVCKDTVQHEMTNGNYCFIFSLFNYNPIHNFDPGLITFKCSRLLPRITRAGMWFGNRREKRCKWSKQRVVFSNHHDGKCINYNC